MLAIICMKNNFTMLYCLHKLYFNASIMDSSLSQKNVIKFPRE